MRDAAAEIGAITGDRSLDEFLASRALRWSVERGCEIFGEALSLLAKIDPPLAASIAEFRKIISFRNILIHGYSHIDDQKTWDIIQQDLPVLRRQLDDLLKT